MPPPPAGAGGGGVAAGPAGLLRRRRPAVGAARGRSELSQLFLYIVIRLQSSLAKRGPAGGAAPLAAARR